jgi:predicted nucleic acid-binding protein
MKVFFDTNVVLDVLLERKPFYSDSVAVWTMAEQGAIIGIIAAISCTNIAYIINRLRNRAAVRTALSALRDVFTIAATDGQTIFQSMDAKFDDFEDAVQYFTALHAGVDCIVTRKPGHFPRAGCPVVSPAEFLAGQSLPE